MTYLAFVLQERRLLTFGDSLTFFSSLGQTFLISLFVPFFLEDFALTNTGFGTMYSAATLISAASMPWLGQWIDRIPLRWYSLSVAIGLVIATSLVMLSWHIAILFTGILFLRLSGQGLSGHTAETAMARLYSRERGKALSVSSLGYPIGEAVLPVVIASLFTILHWRTIWGLLALSVLIVLIPLLYLLIGREREGKINPGKSGSVPERAFEKYPIIFRDPRIWFIIPTVLMPPFWVTGLFLYQISIGSHLGWSAGLIATAFISFAVFRIFSALTVGPLIDRFSAQALFPTLLLPMTAAFLVPMLFSGQWTPFLYMGLLGMTMGAGGNIKSALWAELFGTEMIGTVRSLFSSVMVFSTALSPSLFGWLLDIETHIYYIFVAGVITTLISALLALRIHPGLR